MKLLTVLKELSSWIWELSYEKQVEQRKVEEKLTSQNESSYTSDNLTIKRANNKEASELNKTFVLLFFVKLGHETHLNLS